MGWQGGEELASPWGVCVAQPSLAKIPSPSSDAMSHLGGP